MAMLEVTGLVKIYGRRRVVDGVDFYVEKGEIVGLLGPNGAGKTTSFRMACGMIEPNSGKVMLNGVDVTRWPMYRRSRDGGMGYLAQESSVFRKLSVEQNLLGMMEMLGFDRKSRRRRCDELLEQFNITKLRKSLAMSLSGGERRRLEIARCLVSDPKLILLDEPFTGIDPVTIASIQEIIRKLRDSGISILITDHQVRETLQITDRSYVIRGGKVLCHGDRNEVLQNPEARKYYFGEGMDLGISPCRADPTSRLPKSWPMSPPSNCPLPRRRPASHRPKRASGSGREREARSTLAVLQSQAAKPNDRAGGVFSGSLPVRRASWPWACICSWNDRWARPPRPVPGRFFARSTESMISADRSFSRQSSCNCVSRSRSWQMIASRSRISPRAAAPMADGTNALTLLFEQLFQLCDLKRSFSWIIESVMRIVPSIVRCS